MTLIKDQRDTEHVPQIRQVSLSDIQDNSNVFLENVCQNNSWQSSLLLALFYQSHLIQQLSFGTDD